MLECAQNSPIFWNNTIWLSCYVCEFRISRT